MAVDFSQCDASQIARFLDRELSVREQEDFERHLDCCESCREQLANETADVKSWDETCEFLRDDDFELSPLSEELPAIDDDDFEKQIAVGARRVLDYLSPTDDPHMLGRLGSYEIAGVIGSGGFGIVLKAFDPSLNRFAAIKVLAPHLASSGAARQRFAREAQAAAAVIHDNVIEIYGVSNSDELPYLVMPYVRSQSLQRRIENSGPLSIVEILRIGRQAAAGLAAAHAQGLVHRDVTPANILLADGTERVMLTDFGLARAADDASLTRTGVIAGTPQFMSPEQARGDQVDHRSDLFSLGSVMYMMCTGRPPFRATTSYGILRRITDNDPRGIREVNPDIPNWLEAIVSKLLAKDADQRFQSADEVTDLLEACLAHVQQPKTVALPNALKIATEKNITIAREKDLPRRKRVFAICMASSIIVACLAVAAYIVNEFGDKPTDQAATSDGPPTLNSSSDGTSTHNSAAINSAWHDDTSQMILELDHDSALLESRVEQLWSDDSMPSLAPPAETSSPSAASGQPKPRSTK